MVKSLFRIVVVIAVDAYNPHTIRASRAFAGHAWSGETQLQVTLNGDGVPVQVFSSALTAITRAVTPAATPAIITILSNLLINGLDEPAPAALCGGAGGAIVASSGFPSWTSSGVSAVSTSVVPVLANTSNFSPANVTAYTAPPFPGRIRAPPAST